MPRQSADHQATSNTISRSRIIEWINYRKIAGYKAKVSEGVWHTLALKVEADLLKVAFDGRRVIQVRDATFAGPGKVGLWTKTDSLVHFADLQSTPATNPNSERRSERRCNRPARSLLRASFVLGA